MMIVGNTAKSPAARRAYEDRREALIKEFAPTIKYLASRLAVRLSALPLSPLLVSCASAECPAVLHRRAFGFLGQSFFRRYWAKRSRSLVFQNFPVDVRGSVSRNS